MRRWAAAWDGNGNGNGNGNGDWVVAEPTGGADVVEDGLGADLGVDRRDERRHDGGVWSDLVSWRRGSFLVE